jgi:RND family efflux transporter MFP subunit
MKPVAAYRDLMPVLVLGLIFSAASAGCGPPPAAAEEQNPPAPVKWEPARLLILEEWVELLGTTQPLPDHVARISAPVEGRVQSVLVGTDNKHISEGQPVQAGDVIVQLDDRRVRADLQKSIAGQKALQADLESAKLAQKLAAIDVERLRDLANSRSQGSSSIPLVSQVEIQKARLALEDADAKLSATQARLDAGAKEVESLNLQLKLHTLTSPRKGRLGRLRVVPGDTLAVGAPVSEVVDLDDAIDILCFVAPSVAGQLRLGQAARLGGLDSPSTVDAEGHVEFIADQAEPDSGNLAVKVRFPNQQARLRANMVVRIRVLTKPGKECLAIPESALMEDQVPPGVVIVDGVAPKKNEEGKEEQVGTARRLQAVIGYRDRVLHQVEIVRLEDKEKKWSGSLEEALVIVEKGQGLQTGDAVKLEEEEED